MFLLLTGLAFAGKWDEAIADVQATAVIPAAPETVFGFLLDLANLQRIFPADCIGDWEPGERTFGEGASTWVRYDMAAMHRRLPMTLTVADAPRRVDFDHLGSRGFITRWTLEPADGGSRVTVLTPLNPPPRPFRGYYFKKVKPEWEGCYQRALAALGTAVAP